jgi:hypothetical protein
MRSGRVVVWVDDNECGPVVADHEDVLMACHRFSRQPRYPDFLCLDRGHKTILQQPYGNVRNSTAVAGLRAELQSIPAVKSSAVFTGFSHLPSMRIPLLGFEPDWLPGALGRKMRAPDREDH